MIYFVSGNPYYILRFTYNGEWDHFLYSTLFNLTTKEKGEIVASGATCSLYCRSWLCVYCLLEFVSIFYWASSSQGVKVSRVSSSKGCNDLAFRLFLNIAVKPSKMENPRGFCGFWGGHNNSKFLFKRLFFLSLCCWLHYHTHPA